MADGDRLFMLLRRLGQPELEAIWTGCLREKVTRDGFNTASKERRIALLSQTWRSVHGHSIANRLRLAHDLSWKRVLIDVADKLKPGLRWTAYKISDAATESEIEVQILQFFDERIRRRWEKLSIEEREALANDLNRQIADSAKHAAGETLNASMRGVTTATVNSAITAGLVTGGGAMLIVQSALPGVLASAFAGLAAQLGFTVAVSTLGWLSGLKLVWAGGAATLGGVVIGLPVVILSAANAFMSTSYRKSIPATLTLLTNIELQKQFEAIKQ